MKFSLTHKGPHGLTTQHYETLTVDTLCQHLIAGALVQPHHKTSTGGIPKFGSADFLALAIDISILPVSYIQAAAFTQEYGTLLVFPTSPSVGTRAVLVFQLPEPVVEAKSYALLLAGIETVYAGAVKHRTVWDPVFALGLTDWQVIGRRLTHEAVNHLKHLGVETKMIHKTAGTAIRSRVKLTADTVVTVEESDLAHPLDSVTFDRVGSEVEVFCPIHVDARKQAKTVWTDDGHMALVCHHCKRAYVQEGAGASTYDFERFDATINALSRDQSHLEVVQLDPAGAPDKEPTLLTYEDGVRYQHPVTLTNERYLPSIAAETGVLCVKSPKGSGKTEQLVHIVKNAKRLNQSILLIGHRRSLLQSMTARLGIDCYFMGEQDALDKSLGGLNRALNDRLVDFDPPILASDLRRLAGFPVDPSNDTVKVSPTRYFGVCMDSLTQLQAAAARYELVIIDESEQVFSHLVGDTLKGQRRQVYQVLRRLMREATSIVLLDADLGMVTMQAVFGMGLRNDIPIRFHMNTFVQKGGQIQCYPSCGQLVQRISDMFSAGKKIFVATNSKAKAREIANGLGQLDDSKKIVCVDADNSSSPEIQRVIKNIAHEFEHNIDVLIASPSLGTGVDITFKGIGGDSRAVVDHVFGLFVGETTTHFECDQHLMRVRHPGAVHVWIDEAEHEFEADPHLLREQQDRLVQETQLMVGYDKDEKPDLVEEGLTRIWAEHLAARNASLNRLAGHFRELRQSTGWGFEMVEADNDRAKDGSFVLKVGREQRQRERTEKILDALPFSPSEEDVKHLKRLETKARNGIALTQEENARLERYRIESFYGEDISGGLIEFDDQGKMRRCVSTLALVLAPKARALELDLNDCNFNVLGFDRTLSTKRRQLVRDLLHAADLFRHDEFDTAISVRKQDLEGFVRKIRGRASELEALFQVTVRRDVGNNAVQQLQEILKLVGLSIELGSANDVDGRKVRRYRLDREQLASLMTFARRRIEPTLQRQRDALPSELDRNADEWACEQDRLETVPS